MKLMALPVAISAAVFSVLALTSPQPAIACSLAANDDHHDDPAHESDTTPPGNVTASAEVTRFADNDSGGGCTQQVASCGSYGVITLQVDATDDATPADRLGYQVTVVGGDAPEGLNVRPQALRPFAGELLLYFDYGARSGFEVDLELRAVDLNGNLGPPMVLTISEPPHDEGGGCATQRTPAAALVVVALLVALRRRR